MSINTAKQTTTLHRIEDILRNSAPFEKLTNSLTTADRKPIAITGLVGSSEAIILKAVTNETDQPLVVICESAEEAADLYEDFAFLMDGSHAGHFPARQILPYDFRAPVGEIMGRRISTLAGMLSSDLKVIVTTIRAIMEPTITIENLRENHINLKRGDDTDLDELVDRLVKLGFKRVSLVEEVGDFALRGGLIDFFSPGFESPVRVEFFGTEVDTIREFDVATQRTLSRLEQVQLLPKREIPITDETLESYLKHLPEEDSDYIRSRYFNDPELPGLEWLSVLFGMKQGSFFDYLAEDQIICTHNLDSLKSEVEAVMTEAEQLRERFKTRLTKFPSPEEYYIPPEKLFNRINSFTRIDVLPFRSGRSSVISFGCRDHPSFGSRLDLLGEKINEFNSTGFTYFITSDSIGQAERLEQIIADKTELDHPALVEVGHLSGGFVCQDSSVAILTDQEIFSRHHRRIRRKKFKEGVAISDYTSLNRGDFVVHTEYGIARYLGLETLTVDNKHRDCLLLQYAENDRLFIPIEEFNRVSKYAGKESAPELTRLGGTGWEKLKKRSQKAIEALADDLVKLYAERKTKQGFSFGEDTVWLNQLEASFPFEETVDQARAIIEVKRDMTASKPMDRLICGDVGYGKTEVAVRAAFKAIDSGKQVALLVPTTILAQQHFATFKERFNDFPVKLGLLSRFKTRKEQLQTVKELSEGKVDMVIGTHRLLSKDILFRDIGLLIIDEEHRFGVKHKEQLRKLRSMVDTITMTATPIPRTMQMSMISIRDMSLIATSPKDRLPVITEIAEFDPAIIATVILREINRGGQVFFVHNRVQTIESMRTYLAGIVPQAEIAVAHGQMHERSLEGIMLAFMSGRFNVLLCTSIIESGLDIPNTNTIIINRADRFGLAQLYQLRGRVGRSARRAYAYLLTPPTRLMKRDAIKRLRALEAHSNLGSGFALAMRDLEIRGAGTMLGSKQSGFIEELGFDLYQKLLDEAIVKLKGTAIDKLPETKLESDMEIYLPENYIPDSRQKVDVYRRLAGAANLDEVEGIRDEVTDRFGNPPDSVVNLFDAIAVKISAAILNIEKVTLRAGQVQLFFCEDRQLQRSEVESFRKETDKPMEFSLLGRVRIDIDLSSLDSNNRLGYLRSLLGQI